MASDEDLSMLKLMVGSEMFTDDQLKTIIDANSSDLTLASAQVWEIRAGKYHGLVNISESGSSRSMGDLYKNAIAMASYYRGKKSDDVLDPDDPPAGVTRIGRIVRE
jgi:hypothetical protein